MKILSGVFAAILLTPFAANAQLPVAPFSTPSELVIPSNMPGISPGVYNLARWLRVKNSDTYRSDYYVQSTRRRGSIISFYQINRSIAAESEEENRYMTQYGNGWFLPRYRVALVRIDCENDRTLTDFNVVGITDAWGDEGKTGSFIYPTDKYEKNWEVVPGQVRVFLEGRPYWASLPGNDPRSLSNTWKPEWKMAVPGTYGASHIDYACEYL